MFTARDFWVRPITISRCDYPYGLLHVDGNRALPAFQMISDPKPLASFVISNEHFGRLLRLQQLGVNPKLKVQLTSRFYDEPAYHQNLIAEIPGSDSILKDELVIIGAHLDLFREATPLPFRMPTKPIIGCLIITIFRHFNSYKIPWIIFRLFTTPTELAKDGKGHGGLTVLYVE